LLTSFPFPCRWKALPPQTNPFPATLVLAHTYLPGSHKPASPFTCCRCCIMCSGGKKGTLSALLFLSACSRLRSRTHLCSLALLSNLPSPNRISYSPSCIAFVHFPSHKPNPLCLLNSLSPGSDNVDGCRSYFVFAYSVYITPPEHILGLGEQQIACNVQALKNKLRGRGGARKAGGG
jgi:hypothetical protein